MIKMHLHCCMGTGGGRAWPMKTSVSNPKGAGHTLGCWSQELPGTLSLWIKQLTHSHVQNRLFRGRIPTEYRMPQLRPGLMDSWVTHTPSGTPRHFVMPCAVPTSSLTGSLHNKSSTTWLGKAWKIPSRSWDRWD